MSNHPEVVVIGGPNGAGKTTISRSVIDRSFGLAEFVNADVIAQGLSGFEPERSALEAGRIMLARLHELAANRESFAFERTLASRTFAPWIQGLITSGYRFRVVFVWLNSPELAVQRVQARIARGGHSVNPDVVRRRYRRGIANFLRLYMPLARRWRVYDNSGERPRAVAWGGDGTVARISARAAWRRMLEIADEEAREVD